MLKPLFLVLLVGRRRAAESRIPCLQLSIKVVHVVTRLNIQFSYLFAFFLQVCNCNCYSTTQRSIFGPSMPRPSLISLLPGFSTRRWPPVVNVLWTIYQVQALTTEDPVNNYLCLTNKCGRLSLRGGTKVSFKKRQKILTGFQDLKMRSWFLMVSSVGLSVQTWWLHKYWLHWLLLYQESLAGALLARRVRKSRSADLIFVEEISELMEKNYDYRGKVEHFSKEIVKKLWMFFVEKNIKSGGWWDTRRTPERAVHRTTQAVVASQRTQQ